MHEMKFPINIKYKSYIETLPKTLKEYHLFWADEIKQLLYPSLLKNYIDSDTKAYNAFKKLVEKSTFRGVFTDEEIKNGYILVESRGFDVIIGTKLYRALNPFADMPNYDPMKVNAYWTRRLNDKSDFFTIKTIENIKAGEQIILDYGRDQNQKLLVSYGFTIENNPFLHNEADFEISISDKKFKINLKFTDVRSLAREIRNIRRLIKKEVKKNNSTAASTAALNNNSTVALNNNSTTNNSTEALNNNSKKEEVNTKSKSRKESENNNSKKLEPNNNSTGVLNNISTGVVDTNSTAAINNNSKKKTGKNNSRKNQQIIGNKEIDKQIVNEIISNLRKFSNEERLEKIKRRIKNNPIFVNIYRALRDEQVLLNHKLVGARNILRILNSKTSPKLLYPDDPTYLENKKYFDKLFS